MKKIAAIDIGSNAVRMSICYVLMNEDEYFFQKNQYIRLPLRLGEDSFKTGYISDNKINSLSNALLSFKYTMKVHGVEHYQIYATSGLKEAKVIAMGNPIEKLDFDKTYLYVDVGGGSTEYSIVRGSDDKKSKSFNIGTVRLINNLVDELVFEEVKEWINENIDDESKLKVFATGGNINKIQDMTRTKSGKPISYLSIKDLYNNLLDEDINDRMIKYNLDPDRADVIIPALRIFISTMEWANTNKLFVPKVGLVDGMIKEIHNSMNSVN